MQKRLRKFFRLSQPTIARDLTVSLVLMITLVFGFAGSVNYVYSVRRDSEALNDKAKEIMDNLASVLATPMWNLNTDELRKITEPYRQSGIVLDIRLLDEAGQELIPVKPRTQAAYLELTRIITHDAQPIGRVTVAFSDADLTAKQQEFVIYTMTVFASLTVSMLGALTLLFRRLLRDPFVRIKYGLEVISGGDYTHIFDPVRQVDVNVITNKIMGMAREIARRESALEENRSKLEILNQAILDIFSSSDTESLIRTTMLLAYKVCGVDQGWFMSSDTGMVDAEEKSAPPLVSVRGHTFEATRNEVAPHIGQHDNERHFSFSIKSRYRVVGDMTLAFDAVPDPSVTSLLKSLLSLASLAMIRQSFIRETAMIAAELQVAETVQRSMLLENQTPPANALVAYHYEPVLRVGGDWFSVIESRDGDSLYVILGDVTGHGLAQGLVTTAMSGAISIIESMIQDFGDVQRPSQIVTQLNSVLNRLAGKSNLRMTCVAAQIDFRNMRLFLCNAGHTFPLRLVTLEGGKQKVESLAKNQQHMLGEDLYGHMNRTYADSEYTFTDDDKLVFYTDGLTEAVDKEGKLFLRKFHRHFAKGEGVTTVHQVKDDLIRLFRNHTHEVPVKDDICLLVVGKKTDRKTAAAAS